MKLTIFAATGGIGRQLLEQAVAAGHDVTAVARNPRNLPATPARVVAANLATADAGSLQSAVGGADAVLSALGARTKADTGVAARGTRAIAEAMGVSGVRRLIVVSAAPIGTVSSPGRPHPPRHDPGDGFVIRFLAGPIIKRALRAHYADLAEMEDALRDSDLDWTTVRPPRLTDKPVTGRYRTAYDQNVHRGLLVSRADVAHYMLRALDQPETYRRTVGIARSAAWLPEISCYFLLQLVARAVPATSYHRTWRRPSPGRAVVGICLPTGRSLVGGILPVRAADGHLVGPGLRRADALAPPTARFAKLYFSKL